MSGAVNPKNTSTSTEEELKDANKIPVSKLSGTKKTARKKRFRHFIQLFSMYEVEIFVPLQSS